jgi:chromosome segregation ATPase
MKKPTVKELKEQLSQAQTQLATLAQQLENRTAEVEGLRQSQDEHDDQLKTISDKLVTASRALEPFHDKTMKWEWPSDAILAISPLTFGDLRKARDAAVAIR